jgi:prevent-host-death family protein
MTRTINLYEAKTHLSSLVEAAAAGEEIVIAKHGVAKARLAPLAPAPSFLRTPSGLLEISRIAEDFDSLDEEIIDLFESDAEAC